MCAIFELSTTSYADDAILVKKALSQLETLCQAWNGYKLGEPKAKFGWTFFELVIQPPLQKGIEEKFSEMIKKYRFSSKSEKFRKFLKDYFEAKGCNVNVKLIDF